MYREYETASGVTGYNIIGEEARLVMYRGRDASLTIPGSITADQDTYPVTGIERKTFLSAKNLHHITIPHTVTHIGDWGFAGCINLESVTLHSGIITGNGVFKDCKSLKLIIPEPDPDSSPVSDGSKNIPPTRPDNGAEDTFRLLAATVNLLDDKYLFDLKSAGTDEWYANLDLKIRTVLREPDEEGFSRLLACGEEDYEGRDNTLESYLYGRRCRKAGICLLRLLYDSGLSDQDRDLLLEYIRDHRAGTESPVTWEVVRRYHADEEEYFRLICDHGCVDAGNIDIMLTDLGDSHPKMKSYLIRYTSGQNSGGVFDLTL